MTLSLYSSRAVAACQLFNLGYGYSVVVTLYGVLERGRRNCKVDGRLGVLACKDSIDKSAAKAVAAAYAVNDMEVVGLGEAEFSPS